MTFKRSPPPRTRAGPAGRKIAAIVAAIAPTIAMLIGAPTGLAQEYPRRTVRVIVPFAPAGQVDTVARVVSTKLSSALGRQFIVDNRPGAGGNLGTELAAKADPDGHTLLMVSPSFTINPSLSPHTPYDPRRSFQAVDIVASAPNVLLVHPSLPVKSVRELVAFSRTRPGQIPYASSGVGTPPHLAGELFSTMAGIRLIHVPYRGGGAATADLLGGQVGIMFLGMAPALPLVAAAKVRAIATTGAKRASALPDVPTVAEAGFPKFEIVNWIGMLAPLGTPRTIIERLHGELSRVTTSPEGKEQFATLGLDSASTTPDEFGRFIESEIARWAVAVKAAEASAK